MRCIAAVVPFLSNLITPFSQPRNRTKSSSTNRFLHVKWRCGFANSAQLGCPQKASSTRRIICLEPVQCILSLPATRLPHHSAPVSLLSPSYEKALTWRMVRRGPPSSSRLPILCFFCFAFPQLQNHATRVSLDTTSPELPDKNHELRRERCLASQRICFQYGTRGYEGAKWNLACLVLAQTWDSGMVDVGAM